MPANRPPNEGWRRYRRAGLAAAAVASVSLVTTTAPATAETPAATADPTGEFQVGGQPSTLVAQISAEETRADELAEQADAARIQVATMAGREVAARAGEQASDRRLAEARSVLTHQAVAAYMQSGRLPGPPPTGDVADDPALIDGYASSIAGVQTSAIDTYETLRHRQEAEADALQAAVAAAQASVEQLTVAEQQARGAVAEATTTLNQVREQPALAATVTSDEVTGYDRSAPAVEARFGVPAGSPVGAAPADDLAPATSGATTGMAQATTGTTTSPAPATSGVTDSPPTTEIAGVTQAAPTTTAPSETTGIGSATTAPPTSSVTAPPTTAPLTTAPPTTQSRPTLPPATTTVPRTTVPTGGGTSGSTSGVSAPGSSEAIAYAMAQLGKPYAWGGAGPSSFDCSGLVMEAWASAGVSFPHSAEMQYDDTARVAVSALQPGDLVFFGTPTDVYHVGIYIGAGQMVDAPHTGADVRIEGIYWTDLLAGGRVG